MFVRECKAPLGIFRNFSYSFSLFCSNLLVKLFGQSLVFRNPLFCIKRPLDEATILEAWKFNLIKAYGAIVKAWEFLLNGLLFFRNYIWNTKDLRLRCKLVFTSFLDMEVENFSKRFDLLFINAEKDLDYYITCYLKPQICD